MSQQTATTVRQIIRALHAISTGPGVSAIRLGEVTGLSRASVMRLLSQARQLGAVIEWVRDGDAVNSGAYRVRSWGILDKRRALAWLENN